MTNPNPNRTMRKDQLIPIVHVASLTISIAIWIWISIYWTISAPTQCATPKQSAAEIGLDFSGIHLTPYCILNFVRQ